MTEDRSPSPAIANVESEAALLGALMIDNKLIEKTADIVRPEDFATPIYGRLYTAIQREHGLNRAANPITLRPYFEDTGTAFLADLTGSSASLIGASDFAHQVAELATRRRFADGLVQAAVQCENYELPIQACAGAAEAAISEALKQEAGGQSMSAADAVVATLDAQFGEAPGVQCGIIPSLDHALGPICPGDLVIVAGRPGMGKTALALSYAHGVSEQGNGVTFASLEMRAAQLGGRLVCDVLFDGPEQLAYDLVSENRCDQQQRRAMSRASLVIKEWPLWIEDLPSATITRLGAIVRRHKRRLAARGKTLRLLIVDYLQLVDPEKPGKSLYEDTTRVSRGLKALAKAEGIGVMALCQLSREVERRQDKRPNTSDLRDSGQIEQDADAICFVLRLEEYLKREEPDSDTAEWLDWQRSFERERGKIEFIVAKRRHGVSGIGRGLWYGKYQAVRG